jgi:serine/threonine protein kinase
MAVPFESIGSYRILELLGQGGMGAVYRAEHRENLSQVALKTVSVADEWAVSSLRREIHALSRIRHPQVVRILDEGIEGGMPWYAMELVDGITLRQYADQLFASDSDDAVPASGRAPGLREDAVPVESGQQAKGWWTRSLAPDEGELTRSFSGWRSVRAARSRSRRSPLGRRSELEERAGSPEELRAVAGGRLAEVLTLVRRLCAPLSFLHGEGIVHRDLKPDNVLLRLARGERQARALEEPGFRPVIVDFGLMSQFGGQLSREALEVRGGASGTVAVMSPEQILGETMDARADLYALGCILYELLTGRAPFEGRTPGAVLYGHLNATPPLPSRLASGVPAALDELVLRLLAKKPADRLGHADDVAAALQALGAHHDSLPAPAPRPYLYRPDFAGRRESLDQLSHQLARLEQGIGGLTLIGGESGVGKTRLAVELARRAERRGIVVLAGQCSSGGAPLHPLKPFLQHVADRCLEHGAPEVESLLGPRARLLAGFEPALAGLRGLEDHPAPPELPPREARLRLFQALIESIRALAAATPFVLILDDLQWADELTMGWLRGSRGPEALRGLPVSIVGTYRTEEAGEAIQALLTGSRGECFAAGPIGRTRGWRNRRRHACAGPGAGESRPIRGASIRGESVLRRRISSDGGCRTVALSGRGRTVAGRNPGREHAG